MTAIEQLNSAIERYLRISTTKYLELGEYETATEMLNARRYECIDNFINYELIFKIGYCWSDNIYDIGQWATDPMFRLMYNFITTNSTLISYMANFVNTERTVMDITMTLTDYSPINVLRHYAFYYAKKLDHTFFMQIFVEYFRDIQRPRLISSSRQQDPYDISYNSDTETDTEPDIETFNDKPVRIPPPA